MNVSTLIDHPEFLLLALAPVFFICIFLEWYFGDRKEKLPLNARYYKNEVLCNTALAAMHQVSDIAAGFIVASIYLMVFNWQLFEIKLTLYSFLLLIVLQDFCYYWFHRCSHRIRYMWAAHVVHHSSENMNFSTAFRQSLMYPIAGMWVFWLPLVIIGFSPNQVIFVVLMNLAFQFFVHTQAVRSLGPLEYIFNTPSHHRVHHGINPQYIDKNYAGVFIIWDKLFKTYVKEEETVEYGITKPVNSFNPITVTFKEWQNMFTEAFAKGLTFKQRLKIIFYPPQ